jgi:uncharacterized protein YbjT (DUF2867 family)
MPNSGLILVTGATGQQGGAVARRLLDAGRSIRVLTRDPAKAQPLAERGAEVVRGDMTDPASLERALDGVWGVYAMTTPFEGGTETDVEQGKTMADAASSAAVERYVLSSVIGATDATGIPHIESKGAVEEHLRVTGMSSTILRPVWFMENLLAPWMWPAVRDGTFALPLLPETRLQMVAVGDVGAYAAAAFLRPEEFDGAVIPLASDERTGADLAAALTHRLGHEVRFEAVPLEDLDETLARGFGPEFGRDLAAMYRWFNTEDFPRVDISATERRWGVPLTRFESWLDRLER